GAAVPYATSATRKRHLPQRHRALVRRDAKFGSTAVHVTDVTRAVQRLHHHREVGIHAEVMAGGVEMELGVGGDTELDAAVVGLDPAQACKTAERDVDVTVVRLDRGAAVQPGQVDV